jgi:hypothetical protein
MAACVMSKLRRNQGHERRLEQPKHEKQDASEPLRRFEHL